MQQNPPPNVVMAEVSLWQQMRNLPAKTKIKVTAAVCIFLVVAINFVYLKGLNENEFAIPEPIQGKRVLVTGAAGFIGFHLSQKLHKTGNKVIGLDSYNDYYDQELKRVRANTLIHDFGIKVVEGNVCDMKLLEKLFQQHQFTHVAHLAAQAGVRYSLKNPQSYITNNLMCLTNLLEVVRYQNPKVKFIYASSSSVYGRNKKVPFSEKDPVEHPSNIYGASKRTNEAFALVYHELFGIQVTGLRFFTVYGPYGRPDMAIYMWAKSIAKNEPLRLYEKMDEYGNPITLKRDFTYVDDIVNGIIGSLSLGAELEVFNLGNNTPEPIMMLIKYLAQELGRENPRIQKKPLPAADITQTFADISHAQSRLGFQPTTNLDLGVHKFATWYREYYHPENLVFLYMGTDEAVRDWFNSKTDKPLPNCHYYVIYSENVNQKVINQFTKLNIRFRPLETDPSPHSKYMKYTELLKKFVQEAPNQDWNPKRVVMSTTHQLPPAILEQTLYSSQANYVTVPSDKTVSSLEGSDCSSLTSGLGSKPLIPITQFGGNAVRVIELMDKIKVIENSSPNCFQAAFNHLMHDGRTGIEVLRS